MPTTFAQIFAMEDAVADALVAAFNLDATLGAIAYGPRVLEGLPKSRIDVSAAGFGKSSERQVYAASAWWDQHYAGTVTLSIRTQRGDTAEAADHATRVGRVRYLMSPKAQLLNATNLPSYEILSIDLPASANLYDDATDTDVTTLTYEVHLGILASALAAAT